MIVIQRASRGCKTLFKNKYKGGLTSLTLHDFIILMTLPLGTSGYNEIQMILPIETSRYNIIYTSEYILKLQIHQHDSSTRGPTRKKKNTELSQKNRRRLLIHTIPEVVTYP